MAELRIMRGGETVVVRFEGQPLLDDVLRQAGVYTPHPCGGRGTCGKCAVELYGNVSASNTAEEKAGVRLSCQAVLLGDAVVVLPEEQGGAQIETSTGQAEFEFCPMEGKLGAAVDIGTTTIAVKLYDLADGRCIGTAAGLNPQRSIAADVMGRIEAAMKDQLSLLQQQVTEKVEGLLKEAGGVPDVLVVTGNTTMLYLLTGRDPACLSKAPFVADTLFGVDALLFGQDTYLPPCMNAFVGADITTAVLASGMCEGNAPALLCDIGTNGEMALWKDGRLYVTSTAAGPAFEGAGISCGCGSVRGAIDRVWLEDGELCVHTLDDAEAVGVCGSGLIDAIAAGLLSEAIDETGAIVDDEMVLAENVALQPKDIRAVQLAKAAIAAGMEMLLERAGASMEEVETLYIAGGFGSHLNTESAVTIGLLPAELKDRTKIIGNAALAGAVQTLLNRHARGVLEKIAASSEHVNLGGDPQFNEKYIEKMFFGDDY